MQARLRGIFALWLLLLAGPALAHKLQVAATFTILADVVENVGGDHVTVTSMVGINGDPHVFEPSPADIKQLQMADAIFASGLHLEPWLKQLMQALGTSVAPVYVSADIAVKSNRADTSMADPHVWQNVQNVMLWVDTIEAALIRLDPSHAADFRANADIYRDKLRGLDAFIHGQFDAIDPARRRVLTAHDAFAYYGRAYGVTFLAPQGLSTDAQVSAAAIADLIDTIRDNDIQAYFTENSSDARLVAQVATATKAQTAGILYSESLTDASGPAATYMQLMRYNTEQIVAALTPHAGPR